MVLANPLNYPLAVLFGVIILVLGVRVANAPSLLMLPLAAGIATAGAAVLKARQPQGACVNKNEWICNIHQAHLDREFTQISRLDSERLLGLAARKHMSRHTPPWSQKRNPDGT